ncbi:unnamed protein product [Durusdinium trenchii]|uniref:EF-hand domain-containing protein n=1 Tax=Durusdinium trenchii TaxID=1381693 RepID=A0ABP0IPV6_9DINO
MASITSLMDNVPRRTAWPSNITDVTSISAKGRGLRRATTGRTCRRPCLPEEKEGEVPADVRLTDARLTDARPKAESFTGSFGFGGSSSTGSFSLGLRGRNHTMVSAPFQNLLKQLAQQHVKELAELASASSARRTEAADVAISKSNESELEMDGSGKVERYTTPNMSIEHWIRARQMSSASGSRSNFGGGTGDFEVENSTTFQRHTSPSAMSAFSGLASESFRTRLDRASSPATTPHLMDAAMMVNHSTLRELEAEDILGVWDATKDILASGSDEEKMPQTRCQRLLQSRPFELCMVCLLLANVFWMALHLQVYGWASYAQETLSSTWSTAFEVGDVAFAVIFAVEVTLRGLVQGRRFWLAWMNYIDVIVGIACVIEIFYIATATRTFDFSLIRLLRVVKITKSVRMFNITSTLAPLHLLIKCLEACVGMLFWSFLLMSFVQCMAGIIVSELCYGFISDPQNDRAARDLVFTYYGTFTRTILSMFEIMFANWAPACRVLVDNVSEWFSVFFLVYRCVMGFAVLNVVSAVFVQQAMKTASSDEELAFRQKEREVQAYNRKVLKLFQSIDHSGDGAISLEEFEKLVQSPKLKFWMSQLELEYHDLLSLFEFLDNGDGQITLVEFIEGAQRLRGGAKALDIWRMETKIEVLFEEVLKSLTRPSADLVVEASAPLSSPADTPETTDERPSRSPSKERIETVNVHQVFQKSAFKHIRATTSRHFDAEECG